MPTIKLIRRAETELKEACEWYEKRQKGLSLNLRNEVRGSLNIIAGNPSLFAKRNDTTFKVLAIKEISLCYNYWYDEQLDIVFVTSVFHTKRKPL